MARITITNVSDKRKRELGIAAMKAETSITEALRERLQGITEELAGLRPTREEQDQQIRSLWETNKHLWQAVVAYGEGKPEDAEKILANLRGADHEENA